MISKFVLLTPAFLAEGELFDQREREIEGSPLRVCLFSLGQLVLRDLQLFVHLDVFVLESRERLVELGALHHRLGRHLLRAQLLPLNLQTP